MVAPREPAGFGFMSTSTIHPDPPWQIVDPGSTIICPSTLETFAGFEDQDQVDPFRDGLMIMHRQRQIVVPGRPSTVLVCGYAQVVTITRDAITTHVLGRWPDKVGEVPVREARPYVLYEPPGGAASAAIGLGGGLRVGALQ